MTTLTIQSEQLVEYFICQYSADPFRREPRNVGVIAHRDGKLAYRFVGETSTGIDRRRIRWIHDEDAYEQWVHFWTKAVTKPDWKSKLISSGKRNYFVIDGGLLAGSENDEMEKVVDYLFTVLVERDGLDPLIEEDDRPHSSKEFKAEVQNLFRANGLMANQKGAGRSPIYADRDLFGKKTPHRFAFVQSNGIKRPMEVFDFESSQTKHIIHHAGWARTAFEDVLDYEPTADPFALIRPPESLQKRDTFDHAAAMLRGCCTIIDVTNTRARESFIENCKMHAGLLL